MSKVLAIMFPFAANEPVELGSFEFEEEARQFLKTYMTLEAQKLGTFAIQTAPEKFEFQPHQFTLESGQVLPPETPAMFKIVPYPMAPLTRKAHPFVESDFKNPELYRLASLMLFTMYAAPGIGLAASQIGLDKQIFVMDSDQATTGVAEPIVILNPTLSDYGPLVDIPNEGCLSVPHIRHDTRRAEAVILSGFNLEGEEIVYSLEGWPAAIAQHEYDHLQGKIFLDTLSPLKRTLYKNKLFKANRKAKKFVTQMDAYEQKKKALLSEEESRISKAKQKIEDQKRMFASVPVANVRGLK